METFAHYVLNREYHFKYARGLWTTIGREFHDYDEIVLLPEGHVQLISRDIRMELPPGALVLIPKEQYHQFVPQDPSRYHRCIFGFRETPELRELIREVMDRVTVLPLPPETACAVFRSLIQASQSRIPETQKQLLLTSALPQLLLALKLFGAESIRSAPGISSVTREALSYIDCHFREKLELPEIARRLNVSESTLSHRFQREMNISVYRYISEKRLSAVRQHVSQGESLVAAAEKSGFRDYSGFYRLYKSRYHEYPSASCRVREPEG